MDYVIVIGITIMASALTFLSGFGLGTLLLPVFIFFFPPQIAIAATAVVHLANNLFKALLMGKKASIPILMQFAIPAAFTAIVGASLLNMLNHIPALYHYKIAGHTFSITPIKVLVASMMMVFSLMELIPAIQQMTFNPKWVPLGGGLSGFFGGLTGHQGALRSAFLARLGLDKDTFIGTTIISAILVDVARLLVYGNTLFSRDIPLLIAQQKMGLILTGIIAAFFGAILGYFWIQKVSMAGIHRLIGILLVIYSLALGAGLI